MRNLAPAIGAAVVLSLPSALSGQDLPDLCRELRRTTVGQWASYRLTGRTEGTARFAIVGTEREGSATRYWYEMKMDVTGGESEMRGPMVMQMLVPGLDQPGDVHAMVMKAGNEPAMRMPRQMVAMMSSRAGGNNVATATARRCAGAQVIGWETVTVPAGSMRALHVKSEDGDAWVGQGVPFGIVKAAGAKEGMELTGHGTDAKSSITEKPQEMPGMPPPR